MDTVNTEFIPDRKWPTYSDIYQVNSIELLSGGFRHKVGENVFVPNLGSYKITEVEGNIAKAKALDTLGYRSTTFRDPMEQSNPYDSITNGDGLGITIKPTSSTHIRIINDDVIKPYIVRIQNVLYLISNNLKNPNPFMSLDMNKQIESIKRIESDWNDMLGIYSDYMTDGIKISMSKVVSKVQDVIPTLDEFIECRNKIDLDKYVDAFYKFIQAYTSYMENNDLCTETYFFYHEMCQVEYVKLYNFYGDGRSWNDMNELKALVGNSKYTLNTFKTKFLDTIEGDTSNIIEIFDNLIMINADIISSINNLPNTWIDSNAAINVCNIMLDNVPKELQKDLWYILKHVNPAEGGTGYKVGDVVEIVPELPLDNYGNQIHDFEDIIMNDVILLQVTEVDDDGVVIKLKPLMNYII